ncbi:MAG: hypothetical protein KZQ89_19775 [Candidatus Thiodiazotropha sp. (ex Lucinoma kastoroae)]|nr:hypothetical protein [Candidatus Thiodiazotropha sp. (ex Lucinoma kastoroae)]
MIEHGIFHGIGLYANNNGIENKGLFMLVYNRVGVADTGIWKRQRQRGRYHFSEEANEEDTQFSQAARSA